MALRSRFTGSAFALTVGAAFAAGCSDAEIRVEEYSQTCDVNADCAFAYFGDACGGCLAELRPVNAEALDAIAADVDAARETCAPWSDRSHVECVVPAPTVRPVCTDGVCVEGPSGGDPCEPEDNVCRGADG